MFPEDQFRLTRQAALALMISSTFPAAAYAAAAARVDFAVGPVNVTGPDGRERPVFKGAEINSGDTIHTGSGRAQLRFTDGAYVSLQPQSQFKVDDYRYEGKADGSEKGFFSLLKGGLRTITGAIGRVNRGGYQVQTPTATIGIRGTEYLAALGNSLTVSVGGGIISLTNNAGEFLVGSGQTAYVADQNTLPVLTFEKPVLPPAGAQEGALPPEQEGFISSEQTDAAGNPAILPGTVLPSGPGYTAAFAAGIGTSSAHLECLAGVCGIANGTVTFDATGATHFEFTDDPAGYFVDIGTARVVEGGSAGGVIAWGRWGEGTVLAGGSWNNQPIDPGQGFHYVTGIPTASMPVSGVASYNLIGATTPTFSDGAGAGLGTGTVTGGSLYADFGLGRIGTQMNLSFLGASGTSNYRMSAFGPISGAGISGSGSTAYLSGPVDVCFSWGCPTTILGFFAGSNAAFAGLAYDIEADDALFEISGVSAFQQTSLGAPLSGYGVFKGEGSVAEFGGSLAHLSVDESGSALCSGSVCTHFSGSSSILNKGSTTVADSGFDGIIGWGRWTNGTYTVFDGFEGLTATVGPNQSMHYVVGVPTASMPTSGSATYSVLGATQATSVDGSLGLGTFSGALAGGNVMAVDFSVGSVNMGFNVAFASGTYTATGSTYFSGSQFSAGLSTGGTGSLCASGCSTSVDGFFAGANAERAGIGYDIFDNVLGSNKGVHGAAALTKN